MNRAVGVLSILTLAVSSLVAAESAQEILDKVKQKYESIRDAELKFSQRIRFSLNDNDQITTGTLFLKKEKKYRIELDRATIVTDGVTVWSHSFANHQVLIDRYKENDRTLTPERILAATPKDYRPAFAGTEKIGKAETRVLKLTPNDEASSVESMKLWVDVSTWLIKKVEIADHSGRQTVYLVTDAKINLGIPDSQFTYDIPKGVETVDLR